jgi:hypothetical protein
MVNIQDIKENLWFVSLIAGILGVVSILTPAWGLLSGTSNIFVWLWNFAIINGTPLFLEPNQPLSNIGIVSTIIIVIGTVILLDASILTKVKDREINMLYLFGGIFSIVGITTFFTSTATIYNGFWLSYHIHITGIIPFIAGSLGITAGIIGLMGERKE